MQLPGRWSLILLLVSGAVLAAVYKWTDEQGKTHLSDRPPADQPAEAVPLEPAPAAPPPASGLRPGERQWLDERDREKARRAAQAAREQARQAAQPRQVLGSIVLDWHVYGDAQLPTAGLDATLIVTPVAGGTPQRHRFPAEARDWAEWRDKSPALARALGTFNFTLSLAPGDYRLAALEIAAGDLSGQPFALPLQASFSVPAAGECVYVGRALLRYVRLPAGTRTGQRLDLAAAQDSFGSALDFLYLRQGGLVLTARQLDMEPTEHGPRSLIRKSRAPYERAVRLGCAMQPARFQGG